jgi:succinate-acetate transporter protein
MSYGGFWLSYAVIQIPGFNVVGAYAGKTEQVHTAIGFYLFEWFIFTFLMLVCTLRNSVAFIFLFFTIDMVFLMLAIGEYTETPACLLEGGWLLWSPCRLCRLVLRSRADAQPRQRVLHPACE